MTFWVWRLSEKDAGDWSNPQARPWQCRTFQIDELFNNHELTQGWGVPELDLNLPKAQWVRDRRDWDHAVGGNRTLAQAEKDYDLLICMRTQVRIGDIIFLPKVGNNQRSEDHFTVVTVAGNYRFRNRGPHPLPWNQYTWNQDFGHIIPVENNLIRTFPYSQATLQSGDFGAPFIPRIYPVPNSNYRGFGGFLQQQGYPFTPY